MAMRTSGFDPAEHRRTAEGARILLETASEDEAEEPGAVPAVHAAMARNGLQI